MKNLVLIIAAIALFSVTANAQDASSESFGRGTQLLEAGIGFNSNGVPLLLSYEVGVSNKLFGVEKLKLGLGVYLGYYSYSENKTNLGGTAKSSFTVIAPGVLGRIHYQFIPKLDTYVGLAIGAAVNSSSTSATGMEDKTSFGADLSWGTVLGARYEFTPKWSAFVEAGHATGNLTLGIALKF